MSFTNLYEILLLIISFILYLSPIIKNLSFLDKLDLPNYQYHNR
jgi:hypothetical protein